MNERKASIGAEDRVFKKKEEAKISKMIKIKQRIEKERIILIVMLSMVVWKNVSHQPLESTKD